MVKTCTIFKLVEGKLSFFAWEVVEGQEHDGLGTSNIKQLGCAGAKLRLYK